MNTNCLEGFQCPQCGSWGPFDIITESVARVSDDGILHHSDSEWHDDSACYCCECDYPGDVKDFKHRREDRT